MKKSIALLIAVLVSLGVFAQRKRYNQISLELNYGASVPVTPTTTDRSEAIGFTHVKSALRIMFNPKVGVRGFYAFDHFGEENAGLDSHRLGAELVLNLDDIFNFPYYIKENFGFQAHAGAGLGLLNPQSATTRGTKSDFIGFLIIGGGPQVKLSNQFSLYGDLSLHQLFKQNHGYNGLPVEETAGNFASVSLGVMFYLGRNTHHADWY